MEKELGGGASSSVAGGTGGRRTCTSPVSLETLTEAIFGPITIHVSFLSLQFYQRIYTYIRIHSRITRRGSYGKEGEGKKE